MRINYVPENVEIFIQNIWYKKKIFIVENLNVSKKYFCLCMFPYPSGKLHIGHVRNYTIGDIISNFFRLKDFKVLNTIGWDSFGMPAENAAYNNNTSPYFWTVNNILNMKKQLRRLGFSFDWTKEIMTSNVNYYKTEQLFFIKLYNSGLIYSKYSFVNWDPVDKTVLANEQVVDGKGWRSNALIKKRKIKQWYVKITDYANELLDDLFLLHEWPTKVKEMQKNWIARNIFYQIKFDEIDFCIFLNNILDLYILKSIYLNDKDFFKKNKNYNILNFLSGKYVNYKFKKNISNDDNFFLKFFSNKNFWNFSNFFFKYINIKYFKRVVLKILFLKKILKKVEKFKLQDWCISRQRYWGTPIPILYCNNCGVIPENVNKLPVVLPILKSKRHKYKLKSVRNFYNTSCWICHKECFRETDTFDTFFESSWYYFKYLSKNYINNNILSTWLPVDCYIGGIEHATMHLIYSRFFHKVLRDFGLFTCNEPYIKLLTQGMVLMDGSKISKSKGNIPDQEKLIFEYGADSLRLFIMFAAPVDQSFEWNSNGIVGCKKFLDKIWRYGVFLYNKNINYLINEIDFEFSKEALLFIFDFNKIVDFIYSCLEKNNSFNVIISYLMQILKLLDKLSNKLVLYSKEFFYLFVRIYIFIISFLYPITPHIISFIWIFFLKKDILLIYKSLPGKIVNKYILNKNNNIMLFINNKFKCKIFLDDNFDNQYLKNFIFNNFIIKKYIDNYKIKNLIYKKSKLINIILESV